MGLQIFRNLLQERFTQCELEDAQGVIDFLFKEVIEPLLIENQTIKTSITQEPVEQAIDTLIKLHAEIEKIPCNRNEEWEIADDLGCISRVVQILTAKIKNKQ